LEKTTEFSDTPTAKADNQPITIATTIAPFDIEKQQIAISSWLNHGFHVVSLNSITEIELLHGHFPNVHFVTVETNAQNICGKPLIFFDSFLKYFSVQSDDVCAIVNSDIILRVGDNFHEFIRQNVQNCMIFGSRVDIQDQSSQYGIVYKNGYDFFFFDKSVIPSYPPSDYALGAPWWDYWAVFCPNSYGISTKELLTPIAFHVLHPMNYNMELWFRYGSIFTQFVLEKNTQHSKELRIITSQDKHEEKRLLISSAAVLVNKLIHKSSVKIFSSEYKPLQHHTTNAEYKVSAIVSVYKAERFIKGCLDDLISQSLYKQDLLEIIIINSNSPENEDSIINEYSTNHKHIVYIKTDERETVYEAWNRGILASHGTYITNANTDDRHRNDALEVMARALDSLPDIGIVYADSFVTNIENQTFPDSTPEIRYDLPDFNLGTQLSSSCFGAQPMWRKSVHSQIGYFNADWKIAGDYDFFIHIAWKYKAAHIRETLGLFLSRNDSVSGYDNAQRTIQETLHILRKYRTEIPLQDLYSQLKNFKHDKLAFVSVLWDMGNLCALSPYRDYELALQYYQKALDVDGLSEQEKAFITKGLANNAGVISFCLNNYDQGITLLQSAQTDDSAFNLDLIEKAKEQNVKLYALNFRMTQFNHPVVYDARMAKGLLLNETGNFEFSDDHQQVFWDGYVGMDGIKVTDEEIKRAKQLLPRIETDFSKRIETQSKKKKILMTMYGWNEEGGGTLLPKKIAIELATQGNEVYVFYAGASIKKGLPPYSVVREYDSGVHLFGIFNRDTMFYDLLNPEREIEDKRVGVLFENILTEIKPDIIHFHNFLGLSLGIADSAQKHSIPYIFTPHNYWILCPRLYLLNKEGALCSGPSSDGKKCSECVDNKNKADDYSKRLKEAIRFFSSEQCLIIPPSTRVKEQLIQNGFTEKNVKVVQQVSPTVERLWEQIGKSRNVTRKKSPLTIIYCGALLPLKGVHILVAAVQRLSKDVRIQLYGAGSQQYIEYLRGLDAKGIIEFKGAYNMDDLTEILRHTDLFVAPSLCEETGGLVLTEALAARVPVIASRIGGYTDLVQHDVNGFLFTPGDVQELVTILERIIADNTLLAKLCGKITKPKFFDDYIKELDIMYSHFIYSNNAIECNR